ncbi:MAG: type II and III secretion system protein family protein, partial [bacterium]
MKTRVPMSERILCVIAVALLAWPALAATPAPRSVIRIPVSRSEVVQSPEDLRTVAIADPRIADAAVGSARTVLVTAKSPGTTTLVLYSNTGTYSMHEIRVFTPNAERQVLLHVRVAEVSEEGKRQLGVDWYGYGNRHNIGTIEGGLFTAKVAEPALPPTVGSRTDGILSYANPGGGLKLLSTWRALEEKGEIRTLANPSLLARSGEKAEFLAGGEIPVPIATSAGVAGGASVTIEWKPFGVGVVFTPRVLDDDRIQLSVAPEVSQLDYSNAVTLSGFTVPSLVSRKVSTTVELA